MYTVLSDETLNIFALLGWFIKFMVASTQCLSVSFSFLLEITIYFELVQWIRKKELERQNGFYDRIEYVPFYKEYQRLTHKWFDLIGP